MSQNNVNRYDFNKPFVNATHLPPGALPTSLDDAALNDPANRYRSAVDPEMLIHLETVPFTVYADSPRQAAAPWALSNANSHTSEPNQANDPIPDDYRAIPVLDPFYYQVGLQKEQNEISDFRQLQSEGLTGANVQIINLEQFSLGHSEPINLILKTLAPGAQVQHSDWESVEWKDLVLESLQDHPGSDVSGQYWKEALSKNAARIQQRIQESDPNQPLIFSISYGPSQDALARTLMDAVVPQSFFGDRVFNPDAVELFGNIFKTDLAIPKDATQDYKIREMSDVYNQYTSEERKQLFYDYAQQTIDDPDYKAGQEALQQVVASAPQNVLFVQAAGNFSPVTSLPDGPEPDNTIFVSSAADRTDKFVDLQGEQASPDQGKLFYPKGGRVTVTADSVDALGFNNLDGTSFGTPITASAAALIFEANPDLTAVQVKQLLSQTAYDDPRIEAEREGHGRIRPQVAVAAATAMQAEGLTLEDAVQQANGQFEAKKYATLPPEAQWPEVEQAV
jgi:hypothetical protein